MNSKMTTNSRLSTTEPKKEKTKTKQTTRNRNTEMEITWGVISAEGGEWGEKVQGIRSITDRHKIDGKAQCVECWPAKPKVASSIRFPVRAHA